MRAEKIGTKKAIAHFLRIGVLVSITWSGVLRAQECDIKKQLESGQTRATCNQPVKVETANGEATISDLIVQQTAEGLRTEAIIKTGLENCASGNCHSTQNKINFTAANLEVIKNTLLKTTSKFARDNKLAAIKAEKIAACLLPKDAKSTLSLEAAFGGSGSSDDLGKIEEEVLPEGFGKSEKVSPETLGCRIGNLKGMSGQAAANFYDKYLRDQLQGMLESDIEVEFNKGTTLVNGAITHLGLQCRPPQIDSAQAQTSSIFKTRAASASDLNSGEAYVSESLCDLGQFGQYKTEMVKLETAANQSQNPQEKEMILKAMAELDGSVGKHFSNRGLSLTPQAAAGNSYADQLLREIREYQASLKEDLNSIEQTHNRAVSINNQSATNRSAAPRSGVQAESSNGGTVSIGQPPAPQMPAGPRQGGFQPAPIIGSQNGKTVVRPAGQPGLVPRIR